MKKIIIISMLLNCVYVFSMKINGDYKYYDSETKNQFLLHLTENGGYNLEITTFFTPDLLSGKLISYGRYNINGNSLILRDAENGYIILFVYKKKYIKAQCIYSGLVNKNFGLEGKCNHRIEMINKVTKRKIEFNTIVNNSDKLKLGLYYSDFDVDKVSVTIETSQKFKYIYNNFTLLNGIYKLNNNDLYLFVPELKHTFKFKISNGKIIDNLLYSNYCLSFR